MFHSNIQRLVVFFFFYFLPFLFPYLFTLRFNLKKKTVNCEACNYLLSLVHRQIINNNL